MSDGRFRATLAANAFPGRGGQGMNLAMMADALGDGFDLTVLDQESISRSRSARAIAAVPLLRRRRDWITLREDRHFDAVAADMLAEDCELLHGATGQCLRSQRHARKIGARIVLDSLTLHVTEFGAALDASCARFGIRPPLGEAYRRRCLAEYRNADLIRVMSEVARRTFEMHGVNGEKLVVAPPWIEPPSRPFPPHEGPFRAGFVGLLEPWKGFYDLVEAFGALGLPGAELHLLGGTGSRPVARYLNEAAGRWPGIIVRPFPIDRVGMAAAYGELSVLVHPSLADGFGLVVLEAMACARPAIVSTAAGAADLIDDGVNGYLIEPGDREGIADRLQLLARDPDRCHAMGAAARRRAEQCTREALVSAYVPALRALLD